MAAALLLTHAPAGAAQQGPAYAAPADTLQIESLNPYLMYWVAGSDTLGNPVRAVTLESQVWRTAGDHLHVEVRQERLLPERSIQTDTFLITRRGKVVSINGAAPGLNERIDLLPILPDRALRVGTEWADTLHAVPDPSDRKHFSQVRTYRVERMVDTLGTTMADIRAEGRVRYRDAWPADATQSPAPWIDVAGPVSERVGFDVRAGRVLFRTWQMDLRGKGGLPPSLGFPPRLPAGLLSASRQRLLDPAAAAALRQLPERALEPKK